MTEETKIQNSSIIFYRLLLTGFVVGLALIYFLISFKACVLTCSIFFLLLYFNITITTLGNSIANHNINPNYDIFWKLLFIILSSIGFGIYFNI